ncbi:HD domain-containing protein [Algoriphagus halophytocola]|uniref:HD domain-containing protein n=1 Tax=Algoriphagus halophytocola TaxID=2991499 RepID=A0ABY6MP56_9BACT|nr:MULTISPECIES: HD domain-containing protein [unclassified Algoriphagus]UZD24794.1 HD domain-containing protein [Algoriphagus sp. TR-M5]WBL45101.1 HD domain-containing protein [Algoriphagus sp. TR-M9]
MKSQKILNDPVYGFITIPSELIFSIIDHPYFQRLRRIKQLGLTDFVYPGALHTRFHHAIGAMHLMSITLDNLRNKGTEITDQEYEAALIAILLHDVGHGPFSHALEYSLLQGIPHEELSLLIIQLLNEEFGGKLDLTLRIFKNQYERRFFHQLVSSQLDIDRLDYLQRDCFFTGVSEGTIGADRIIKMMDVKNDQVVIEEKGIYSIENFLSARRLMYWQVYLHKTTVSAEKMLIKLIQRARHLRQAGTQFTLTDEFDYFLDNSPGMQDFRTDSNLLRLFLELDDLDIWGAVKLWKNHPDYVLRNISQMFLSRNLFKISLVNEAFSAEQIQDLKEKTIAKLEIPAGDIDYFFSYGAVSNYGYLAKDSINILTKKGQVIDVAKAADLPNIKVMSKIVEKYYVCKAKSLNLNY